MRLLFVFVLSMLLSTAYSQSGNEIPENYVIAWGAAPGWYSYAGLFEEEHDSVVRDEDGNPRTKGKYLNGKADGMWVGYFADGKVQVEGKFSAGIPEGIWIFSWENGNTLATGKFGAGQFELGCAGSENYTTAGAQQGEWAYYDVNGKLTRVVTYSKNGELLSEKISE